MSVFQDHVEPIHISCALVGYCEVFWCCGCCRKGQKTCTCVLINIAGSVVVTESITRMNLKYPISNKHNALMNFVVL